ncbi:MAG: YdcF family protein, partial [Mesotoga sp.]|nr:YdcF family protein [Mesotoga sp.]
MFYLEKILSSILTPPGLVILILLILALTLLRKKDARGIRAGGIVLLILSFFGYLLSTGLGTYLYLRPLEKEYPVPKSVSGQVIVALSSGVI